MALDLLSGADCGPLNPLATLSKTYGRDRGIQQDRFLPVAGPSSQLQVGLSHTRTHITAVSHLPQQSFRSHPQIYQDASHDSQAFDLQPLREAVDTANVPQWAQDFTSRSQVASPTPQWAQDFRQINAKSPFVQEARHMTPSPAPAPILLVQRPFYRNAPMVNYAPMSGSMHMPQQYEYEQQAMQRDAQYQDSQWQTAFDSQATFHKTQPIRTASPPLIQNPRSPESDQELAKTAAELLEAVSKESNPKFAQSSFMDLMHKLKTYQAVVDGNEVVEQEPTTAAATASQYTSKQSTVPLVQRANSLNKGKQRAFDQEMAEETRLKDAAQAQHEIQDGWTQEQFDEMQAIWDAEYQAREEEQAARQEAFHDSSHPYRFFQGDGGYVQEDDDEIIDDRFDARNIIGAPFEQEAFEQAARQRLQAEHRFDQDHWGHLQDDWDAFEATATGFRSSSVDNQTATEEIQARRESLRNSLSHLQQEVEAKPKDPQAWLRLGIKQQENEREEMAIQALKEAIKLDDSLSDAWLALAVSYANESSKAQSCDAVFSWINSRTDYAQHVAHFRQLQGGAEGLGLVEKHAHLTSMLIYVAQATAEQAVEADLQIALGVLFNSADDFAKAGDCFAAALSVRPHDHILYNRLGATLANSGRTEEATQYYFEALRLEPSYARARFNLAVSCISMNAHREAAEHLLTALSMQDAERSALTQSGDADAGRLIPDNDGPMSSTLWETLATSCSLLGFPELVEKCQKRDLNAFRDRGFAF